VIEDLFKVLNDDVIKIEVENTRWLLLTFTDGTTDSMLRHLCKYRVADGEIYYRKGHEPKKILLTAEDLDKRSDLRVKDHADRTLSIVEYTVARVWMGRVSQHNTGYPYQELADNYTWLDGTPCYKTED
jgi:hypothetical protein